MHIEKDITNSPISAHNSAVVVWSNGVQAFPSGDNATTKKATITITLSTYSGLTTVSRIITVTKTLPI